MYRVDPVTAEAFKSCIDIALGPRAVRCSVTETASSIIFETTWRRTSGEDASSAPRVAGFTFSGATCRDTQALAPGVNVPDGGVAVLCQAGDDVPLFAVNTNRGQCFAAGSANRENLTLTGNISLDKPTVYRGRSVVLAADARVTTNGFPLRVQADSLRIEGSPTITSFAPRQMEAGQSGRTASTVDIFARRVSGGGLTILNAGEGGAAGRGGRQGAQGPRGTPGESRAPVREFPWLPIGCTGGANGGPGGPGSPGEQGGTGGSGGNAGEVRLSIPDAVGPSAPITIFTNTDITGVQRNCDGAICGGAGALGGPGGPGGPGGQGGEGGPGTTWCGGTGPGPGGPSGPPGAPGAVGEAGLHARAVIQ